MKISNLISNVKLNSKNDNESKNTNNINNLIQDNFESILNKMGGFPLTRATLKEAVQLVNVEIREYPFVLQNGKSNGCLFIVESSQVSFIIKTDQHGLNPSLLANKESQQIIEATKGGLKGGNAQLTLALGAIGLFAVAGTAYFFHRQQRSLSRAVKQFEQEIETKMKASSSIRISHFLVNVLGFKHQEACIGYNNFCDVYKFFNREI